MMKSSYEKLADSFIIMSDNIKRSYLGQLPSSLALTSAGFENPLSLACNKLAHVWADEHKDVLVIQPHSLKDSASGIKQWVTSLHEFELSGSLSSDMTLHDVLWSVCFSEKHGLLTLTDSHGKDLEILFEAGLVTAISAEQWNDNLMHHIKSKGFTNFQKWHELRQPQTGPSTLMETIANAGLIPHEDLQRIYQAALADCWRDQKKRRFKRYSFKPLDDVPQDQNHGKGFSAFIRHPWFWDDSLLTEQGYVLKSLKQFTLQTEFRYDVASFEDDDIAPLSAAQIKRLMRILKKSYDVVIWNIPNPLENPQHYKLYQCAEASVISLPQKMPSKRKIKKALTELKQGSPEVLGVVLNQDVTTITPQTHQYLS